MRSYSGFMTEDPSADFLAALDPGVRAVAARIIAAIPADLTVAVKWRQLTFALDTDYDHWICAISATKYTRRLTYRSGDDVQESVIEAVVAEALDVLPRFRQATMRAQSL